MKKTLSPQYLKSILKRKKELGDLAEKICFHYEQLRLKNMNKPILSKLIKPIFKKNVNAGYDIESFDGNSKLLKHDRFIEVKSCSSTHISFYWTKNEISKAKELKNNYWIYIFTNFSLKSTYDTTPLEFQNPIQSILKNSSFKVEKDILYIEEKI